MELALLQSAAGQFLGGIGGKRDVIARRCRVDVYKLCTANDFAVQLINGVACHKLAFAVICDIEGDLVFTVIVLDSAEVVIHLTDDIGLFAYVLLREVQGKRNVAVFIVPGGSRNCVVCLIEQFKREFALVQCACADLDIQYLGGFQSYRNTVGGIAVDKFCDVVSFGISRVTVHAVALIITGFAA